ncbi:MAG: pacearchaeosortase [Candidatus Pacearchaeota archaeon]|jgi:hypothetical protein
MKNRIKNNKNYNPIFILLRFILILVLILLLDYIYIIFTPLTVTPVAILLKIIYPEIIHSSNLIINGDKAILLIPACIAGSAYLLIFILNLSVKMKPLKRFYSLGFLIISLLFLNIARIFLLGILNFSMPKFFDFTHFFFWFILSTFFVVGLWLINVRIFKIKEIPVYSDLKYLFNKAKSR